MEGTFDDAGTEQPGNGSTSEQDGMTDIGMSLIRLESLNQTIAMELRKSQKNSDKATALALESLLPSLNGLQSSLRKSFDTHARPLIRKRHILELPRELLMNVCEDVRGEIQSSWRPYPVPNLNLKDIKSLRLTCWDFCKSSSHLLIHDLRVSLTESSLAHLEEVSLHPTISKGVRTLYICLALQNPALATSMPGFVRQAFWQLKKDLPRNLIGLADCVADYDADVDSIRNVHAAAPFVGWSYSIDRLREQNKALSSCLNYLRGRNFSSSDDGIMKVLLKIHQKCVQLRLDQEKLLRDDDFAAMVATSVKRMPTVANLFITDSPAQFEMQEGDDIFDDKLYYGIFQELLDPKHWVSEATSLLPQQPVELLYQLPVAIAREGNPFTKLVIELFSNTELKVELSEEDFRELGGVAEHLEVLEVECTTVAMGDVNTKRRAGDLATLTEMMSPLFTGKKLRDVRLWFKREVVEPQAAEAYSAGPLLASLAWANLRSLSLRGVSINCKGFRKHLEKLQSGTLIKLGCVHLQSGLWADLLDVLREKANSQSVAIDLTSHEDQYIDPDTFELVTGEWGPNFNLASQYIQGRLAENPLRPRP